VGAGLLLAVAVITITDGFSTTICHGDGEVWTVPAER
jgi:hypothetical protein